MKTTIKVNINEPKELVIEPHYEPPYIHEQTDNEVTPPCPKNTINYEAPYLHGISDIQISVNTDFDKLMNSINGVSKKDLEPSSNVLGLMGINGIKLFVTDYGYIIKEGRKHLGKIYNFHKVYQYDSDKYNTECGFNIISIALNAPFTTIDSLILSFISKYKQFKSNKLCLT